MIRVSEVDGKNTALNRCDNCSNMKQEVEFVKWPGLDSGSQYEAMCSDCRRLFLKWRQTKDSKVLENLLSLRK